MLILRHRRSSNKQPNFAPHRTKEEKTNEAKVNKRKEIKINVEISEMETKNRKKINKTRF